MKKLKFLLIIFISIHKSILCQTNAKITAVDFGLENNSIVVNYSISDYLPNELFTIGLKFLTETNQEIMPRTIYGEIGDSIKGEGIKTIVWDIVADRVEVSGVLRASVSIIKSEIIMEVPLKTKSMGGPSNALLSVLVPGLGGYFVEKNKVRPILTTVSTIGLMAYGISQKNKADKYFSDYENCVDYDQIQTLYDKANSAHRKSYISTRISMTIWISDIIYVTYRGIKNKKEAQSGKYSCSGERIKLNYFNNEFQLGYEIIF